VQSIQTLVADDIGISDLSLIGATLLNESMLGEQTHYQQAPLLWARRLFWS